jgi:hypothetical protein
MGEARDTQDKDALRAFEQEWDEPDYLAALENACRQYEETLRRSFQNRHRYLDLPGMGPKTVLKGVHADAECVRFARGCVKSFADGGFDALFDFQREFIWHYNV